MILKDKVLSQATSPAIKAGQKQEQDVAFFLRRHFKEDPKILVFNDLKFRYNGETAQIDHLVLYPYGFILIESKSITGEISVNQQEEWSRSYNGQWRGMASPIKQVELQQKLLRDLLFECRTQILETFLRVQQSFGGRCWDNLCAVSSNAIINRDCMPKVISEQLVKSEFLADKLKAIMKIRNPLVQMINIIDSRPVFNEQEMQSIADFLLSNDCSAGKNSNKTDKYSPKNETPTCNVNDGYSPWKTPSEKSPAVPIPVKMTASTPQPMAQELLTSALKAITMRCSKCDDKSQLLTPNPGKFGYYYKCSSCNGNTPMKQPCPQCQSKKTKVSKKKETYTLNCQDCEESAVICG